MEITTTTAAMTGIAAKMAKNALPPPAAALVLWDSGVLAIWYRWRGGVGREEVKGGVGIEWGSECVGE